MLPSIFWTELLNLNVVLNKKNSGKKNVGNIVTKFTKVNKGENFQKIQCSKTDEVLRYITLLHYNVVFYIK